jgi:carbon-monoxide dehydrogenase large subunit
MYVGQPLKRREDVKFLTGSGRYVDDLNFDNLAYIGFVRSPHAHAKIKNIIVDRAAALPGVLKIVTAADWQRAGFGKLTVSHTISFSDGRPMNTAERPAFAAEKICHVGDVVAAVVATSKYAAADAVDAVEVEYEELPANIETEKALDPSTPVIHPQFGSNLATEIFRGDRAATAAAFARAVHVTELTLVSQRVQPNPLEPLSYVATHDNWSGETTLWATHQKPHWLRAWICEETLHFPQHKLRVISPDVGGGFGAKGSFTPEVSTVVWMARELGRPVKWTATRSEEILTATQARDHVTKARMAFDKDGIILGLEVDTIAAFGAYTCNSAPGIPGNSYPQTITGLYRTRNLSFRLRVVYTNTLPVTAYRGSGRPEATFVNERLLENGAREMGIDPVEMRRRNLIGPDEFPYTTPQGRTYDCGNPPALLDKIVSMSRYEKLRQEQKALRKKGTLLGVGIAAFLDKSGTGPSRQLATKGGLHGGYESVTARATSDGKMTLTVGSHSHGQGHDISFAAIAADRLGLTIDDIEVIEGDTARVQFGNGTWGSRSISVGGAAIYVACDKIIAKARRIAGHILEADEADLVYENQFFFVPNTNRKLSFAEIAKIAYNASRLPAREGFEPGLEFTVFHDPPDLNDPLAMHLAVVIVDPRTGAVKLREYYTVDDCGTIVNPLLVEGQVHGGLAQGLGEAIMEAVVYDKYGQLLTGSFVDYAMPRANDMPPLKLDFHVTPAPSNPLGVKGGSETGTIGPRAAIANAVVDALWPLGIRHVKLPLTPHSVWQAVQAAKKVWSCAAH